MRILHVCHEYAPTISGVRQVVQELAERQAKEGHEVSVYTSDWDKEKRIKKRYEIINGVQVFRFRHWFRVGNFAVIYPSFLPKLLKENFDVIHSHVFGHVHFVLAAFAAKIKKIPHIHTTHCPWTDAYRSLVARFGILVSYNLVSRFALKFTDKVIAITPWEIEKIQRYGCSKEKIIVIPNGMSSIFFKKIIPNDFKIKRKINKKIILFFGRLNVTKAPDKFVQIAKIILKKRDDVVFLIVGPDEGMKEKIKEMIGKEKRIILLDAIRDRTEIVKMYQSSDIYVLPSYREGLPLTLFEAMASGLPIVASPVNGVPYEMKEPENGFLVNYGNNELFAKKIEELLDNKKLRKKISKNNMEKAKQYDWKLISDKTISLYIKAIKEKNHCEA